MSSTDITPPTQSPTPSSSSDDSTNCGSGGGSDSLFGVRVASVFIILFGSTLGAMFPIIAQRTRLRTVVPAAVFDFAKYFGSGVIIATAFIHLLSPGIDELTSPCLNPAWLIYPYPLALCMLSMFIIFFVELAAFRIGTARLAKLGITYDAHGHGAEDPSHSGHHAAHGPENKDVEVVPKDTASDSTHAEKGLPGPSSVLDDSAAAQIIGVGILEFGVLLHSVLIGLTLAVDPDFKTLFVVIVFHQMFEGLGVGSRLAFLRLPKEYNYVAIVGGLLYGITTPIGIAVGLGVRSTYNPGSTTASIVSGVMDSLSSGILLYTGLVELLAHEFLFNPDMNRASNKKLLYACTCMIAGAGIMALLGRWA